MFKNKRWNSIIEVMIVILILSVGIIGTYNILNSGQKLSNTSENRIKAINIAREWMEAVENIRDTNWIRFSSDYEHCWKTKDYDALCIGNTSPTTLSGSNTLAQSGTLWFLSGVTNTETSFSDIYRNNFPVYIDSNGLTAGTGTNIPCNATRTNNCRTIFTREIQINHPDGDHIKVNSIVKWADSSAAPTNPHTINLETTLTNWKKKF